jgi:hypothetical protein
LGFITENSIGLRIGNALSARGHGRENKKGESWLMLSEERKCCSEMETEDSFRIKTEIFF